MKRVGNQLTKALKLLIRFGLIVVNDGLVCLRPNKQLVMFESFNGNDVNDNPAAIYHALVARKPDLKKTMYFAVKPSRYRALRKSHPEILMVKRFSLKWVWLMSHAGFWVINSRLPGWWRKNRRTIYLQTWHGTPLKHLGLDIQKVAIPGSSTPAYGQAFIREAGRWQYLIAPNAYSKAIFKSAFCFNQQFLPIGYPRNDVLYTDNHAANIKDLKQQLVGSKTATVIMYAPTWRDDEAIKTGQYHFQLPFDLAGFFSQVEKDTVLVLRPHYLVKDRIDLSGFEDRVKVLADVDIAQLYLISDLLITDYSSVMFDYANLKRPMLFYAYDLEHYRDELRGFYFNYQAEIPGPLATNEQELFAALKLFSAEHDFPAYKTALLTFNQKYCQWENGQASQKAGDVIIKEMQKWHF